MDNALSWLTNPVVTWIAAAVVGGTIGAFVNGMVSRRLRRVGGVQFLRTRIIAEKPRDTDSLASNSYFLELRMHNTSDEPKVVDWPRITFNSHPKGIGMNIPFRLLNKQKIPVEYLIVPPRELTVQRVWIDTGTFDFAGIPEPRRNSDGDLSEAFKGTHVLIHFRYPNDRHLQSQLIIDTTERKGWEYQDIVFFPESGNVV